jgi:hypothetical protein
VESKGEREWSEIGFGKPIFSIRAQFFEGEQMFWKSGLFR